MVSPKTFSLEDKGMFNLYSKKLKIDTQDE